MRKADRRLRLEALIAYGGKCACCGETYEPFLQIDHIVPNPLPVKDRRSHANHLNKARREHWPPEYQVLCANCNWRKSIGESCDCQTAERFTLEKMLHEVKRPDPAPKIELTCVNCNKVFWRNKSQASRGIMKFCSARCRAIFGSNKRWNKIRH